MEQSRKPIVPLETQLGVLAMRFRSTREGPERARVAAEYAELVRELIASKEWGEMPAFEDMLPDEWMPSDFFEHWSIPLPTGAHGLNGTRGARDSVSPERLSRRPRRKPRA